MATVKARLNSLRTWLERRLEPVLATTYGRALRRSLDAGALDSAASLTYYLILSLVPCVTLMVAIVGLVGRDPETTQALLDIVRSGGSAEAADFFRGALETALESEVRSGTALGIGAVITLWVASLYVAAFTRAAAAIGGAGRRSSLTRRPLQVLVTFVGLFLLALVLLLLVLSRRLTNALASETGLEFLAQEAWPFARWAAIIAGLVVIVAGLYSLDPTRDRGWPPRPTRGSLVAVALWLVITIGFEIYLDTLASYDQTYGAALGGIISFLVWAWLTNIALIYGLAVDQERRDDG